MENKNVNNTQGNEIFKLLKVPIAEFQQPFSLYLYTLILCKADKRNAYESLSQTWMLFPHAVRNRGHGPKIISACCSTTRFSLRITSAGTRRRRIEKGN